MIFEGFLCLDDTIDNIYDNDVVEASDLLVTLQTKRSPRIPVSLFPKDLAWHTWEIIYP